MPVAISLRLKDEETRLIRTYAQLHNQNLSEFIRQTVLERIEDECDLCAYEDAVRVFREDPQTFTLDEVEQALGFQTTPTDSPE